MSCQDAIIKNYPTTTPDHTVATVVAAMRKAGVSFIPVTGSDGALLGCFTFNLLLDDAMSVSLSVGTGEAMSNITLPVAPGLANRLRRGLAVPVSALMRRPAQVVHPETDLPATAREVFAASGPVPVVDRTTNKFIGVVTEDSIIAALEKAER